MTDEERVKAKQNYKNLLKKKADEGEFKTQANILALAEILVDKGIITEEDYAKKVSQATDTLVEAAINEVSDKDLELFKNDIASKLLGVL